MNTLLPALSGTRLHLWPIIREAFAFPWKYRHSLWKWVLVCSGLVGLMNFSSDILLSDEVLKEYGFLAAVAVIILQFILVLTLYVVFCIRCHRLILLGHNTDTEIFPPPLGEREGNFYRFIVIICTGTLFVICCGVFFAFIPFMFFERSNTNFMEWPFLTLIMIPPSYILGRICMVLPATAIDLQPTLNWAWEQSKDVAWRLGILVSLVPWFLSFLYNDPHTRLFLGLHQYPLANSLITGLLWFVCTTIEVALLSIAFRELSGFVSQEEEDRKVGGPETAKESHV